MLIYDIIHVELRDYIIMLKLRDTHVESVVNYSNWECRVSLDPGARLKYNLLSLNNAYFIWCTVPTRFCVKYPKKTMLQPQLG